MYDWTSDEAQLRAAAHALPRPVGSHPACVACALPRGYAATLYQHLQLLLQLDCVRVRALRWMAWLACKQQCARRVRASDVAGLHCLLLLLPCCVRVRAQ